VDKATESAVELTLNIRGINFAVLLHA